MISYVRNIVPSPTYVVEMSTELRLDGLMFRLGGVNAFLGLGKLGETLAFCAFLALTEI